MIIRDLRVGEVIDMQDGVRCEVVATPNQKLTVLKPIVREKTMSLIRHNKKQKFKVIVIRKTSKIIIPSGQYIDFYI